MQLTIEKMIYGGDGLGRLPADASGRGKAVFVPFVLEGECVEIEVAESRPGFARGQALSLVSRSPHRVEAACPYFGRCGGCHYQQAGYEHQLAVKQQIMHETLRRTAKMEMEVPLQVHASPPWQYRNRTRLKVHSEPFGLGYFAHGSHRFIAVEQCPISSPLINRALGTLLDLDEFRPWAPNVAEVELFANHDDSALLAGFYIRNAVDAARFRPCYQAFAAALPELQGATLILGEADEEGGASVSTRQVQKSRLPAPASARRASPQAVAPQILGERWLHYATAEGQLLAGAGSFFQTNRFLVDELARTVVSGAQGRRALDLYAGVGLFSLPLSRSFERLTAVELAPSGVEALRANSGGTFKVIEAATERFLRGFRPSEQVDMVVVDPPRAGLGENMARALAAMRTPRLTYVSCDPATMARDLRPLLDAGFRVREAHLLDLFPQTFHMETVLHLER